MSIFDEYFSEALEGFRVQDEIEMREAAARAAERVSQIYHEEYQQGLELLEKQAEMDARIQASKAYLEALDKQQKTNYRTASLRRLEQRIRRAEQTGWKHVLDY